MRKKLTHSAHKIPDEKKTLGRPLTRLCKFYPIEYHSIVCTELFNSCFISFPVPSYCALNKELHSVFRAKTSTNVTFIKKFINNLKVLAWTCPIYNYISSLLTNRGPGSHCTCNIVQFRTYKFNFYHRFKEPDLFRGGRMKTNKHMHIHTSVFQ